MYDVILSLLSLFHLRHRILLIVSDLFYFQKFIGDPKGYSFLCLIPDFENNPNSSLAFTASELISLSQQNYSGFYLNREKKLISTIKLLKEKNIKFILFGLSFALLDFAEKSMNENLLSFQKGNIKILLSGLPDGEAGILGSSCLNL